MGIINRKAILAAEEQLRKEKKLKEGESINSHPKYRLKPVLDTGPGLTKQDFGEESNINYIMKRFQATGQMPVSPTSLAPVFADVSGIGGYADVVRRVTAVEEAFAQLSPEVRKRFSNEPLELVEFLQDPANRDEAVKLGLVIPGSVDPPKADPLPPKAAEPAKPA